MAYTPTVWQCGDVVSAEKLNKLENGLADCCGGGGTEPLIVTDTENALDKTWQEIYDAVYSGRSVYISFDANTISGLFLSIYQDPSAQYNAYNVVFASFNPPDVTPDTYTAAGANSYPVLD